MAEEAGRRAKDDGKSYPPSGEGGADIVFCSPLRRCLQTASLAFPSATRAPKLPRIVCDELVREAHGMHHPDRRGSLSDARHEFPWVNFSPNMTEVDTVWRPDRRESTSDVVRRLVLFIE